MKNWSRGSWFKITGVAVILLFVLILLGSKMLKTSMLEIKGKWQAAYYPNGCLDCEGDYIFSPFFDTVNECISWVHAKAETRRNNTDAAECSFDCKKNYNFGGIQVCKETVDVLGKPSL